MPVTTDRRIINVGTPVELPAAAPIDVRAAALGLAYAVEEMAEAYKVGDDRVRESASAVVTIERRHLAEAGWKLDGIGRLSNGSDGWKLVAA